MDPIRNILNISAYRFVALADPPAWRERLLEQAAAAELKGTILVAGEGLNLFLAGPAVAVRAFVEWLAAHPEFAGLAAQESWSDAVPFRRLQVKLKPEIIRMNHATVRPQERRAPGVDAATLARWLDAGCDDTGRTVVMLDTRNAFEVDQGRFRGALDWRLDKFSDFPRALAARRDQLAGKTVVSYCTGGIRCEKAALLMHDTGLDGALQLEGGILGYFEQVGGRHFEGDCYVFDARRSLNDTLAAAEAT